MAEPFARAAREAGAADATWKPPVQRWFRGTVCDDESAATIFAPEVNDMRKSNATSKSSFRDKGLAARPSGMDSRTDVRGVDLAAVAPLDDPHDGRAHSGLSGDDGSYQPVDSPATAVSLQPGHTGDLGAAHDIFSNAIPSPAEAYANTGQANTEPGLRESADTGEVDDIDSNHSGVRSRSDRESSDPLANDSGVGLPRHSESALEQPRGDGNYRKDGGRNLDLAGNANPEDA